MAKTLLDGVNEVLIKAQAISSSNKLASLTHSGKQVMVDQAVQAWNEGVDELYSVANRSKPLQMGNGQITLKASIREYALKDDLVRLHWPLHDETNGWFVYEYRGGFEALRASQSHPNNYTGVPSYAVIRPDNGRLYFDRLPGAGEAGRIFKYIYDTDLDLTRATDPMPFNNAVFRAMVPVVFEMYRSIQHNREDGDKKSLNFGRAAMLLNETPTKDSWIVRAPRRGFDPFNA